MILDVYEIAPKVLEGEDSNTSGEAGGRVCTHGPLRGPSLNGLLWCHECDAYVRPGNPPRVVEEGFVYDSALLFVHFNYVVNGNYVVKIDDSGLVAEFSTGGASWKAGYVGTLEWNAPLPRNGNYREIIAFFMALRVRDKLLPHSRVLVFRNIVKTAFTMASELGSTRLLEGRVKPEELLALAGAAKDVCLGLGMWFDGARGDCGKYVFQRNEEEPS